MVKNMKKLWQIVFLLLLFPASSFGGTILFQENFEDTNLSSRGWYDVSGVALSTVEHISGSVSSFECRFLLGGRNCSGGSPSRHIFTATDEVYISYYVKYSTNYTGSNRGYHPHEFYIITNENTNYVGPAYTHLTAYVEQNEGTPALSLQDGENIDLTRINQDLTNITESRSIAGCNGVPTVESPTYIDCYRAGSVYWNDKTWRANQIYFQDVPGVYYKNNWHKVEAYFKLNTVSGGKGQSDGIIRYWYDGNLIIERTNIIMRTAQHPNMKFNQLLISPYIGDGSPVDQTMWIDDLTVATSIIQSSNLPPSPPQNLNFP